MQCRFSFKHMKSSPALTEYAEPKVVQKIERFSTKPIEAHITFSVENQIHSAHCSVKGGDGFNIQVQASSPDMYATVDLLLDKLESQLRKQKEKIKHHKNATTLKSLPQRDIDAEEDYDNIPIDADDLIKFEKAKMRA